MSTPGPNAQNPYAPPSARVQDIATVGPGDLAERSQRLGAVIVDILTGVVVYIPTLFSLVRNWDRTRSPLMNLLNAGGGLWVTGVLAVILLIVTIVLVARYGQTIGKRALGIRVARPDGSKASLGRIFWLRNVVNTVLSILVGAILGAVLGAMGVSPLWTALVGYVYPLIDTLMIFGESRQCLHDRIADTIVVKA
jgi:uncharacterized RDD family membrane protein YckC